MDRGDSSRLGKVVQVIGPVLDVEFEPEHLPEIYNALRARGTGDDGDSASPGGRGAAAHRPQPGARRGHGLHRRRGARHGGARHRRSRSRCRWAKLPWAASSTCSASRWTRAGPVEARRERWPIHRRAAEVRRPRAEDRDLRDRHQGRRPARPVREGRQDGPVRRRRRRQDRHHHGAHQQHRAGARRLLRVLRRG